MSCPAIEPEDVPEGHEDGCGGDDDYTCACYPERLRPVFDDGAGDVFVSAPVALLWLFATAVVVVAVLAWVVH